MISTETQLKYGQKLLVLNEQIAVHLRKHWIKWAMMMALAIAFQQNYMLGLNLSPSLPQTMFLIQKGVPVQKGDYAAFNWHGQGGFYVNQPYFTKIVKGIAGDVITVKDRDVFINGELVAHAKEQASTGKHMDVIEPRVLAQGEFYMFATNPKSLDSRYSVVGVIPQADIIGRAIALF